MPLIPGSQLLERFRQLVGEARRIDIAVAWASSCDEIQVLATSDADIRTVVGTSGNSTNPSTLRHLTEFAELRIPSNNPPRIFHPKYYLFHGEKTVCWVGSANLTKGGFGGNVELIHEFDLTRKEDREWFECLWADLDPDPWPAISEYEERYTPPQRTSRPAPRRERTDLPSLADIDTWEQFVEGLRVYDEYYRHHEDIYGFDVLGETHSWLHTINTGHEIVALNDWTRLTQRECRILRGFTAQDDEEGNWGLLGTIGFQANLVLNNNRMPEIGPDRQQIRDLIGPVLLAADNIADVAHAAVQEIRAVRRIEGERPGVGHAAATRWLALARPDCLVSVNGASEDGLGEAANLPENANALANVYADLLGWLHEQNWFNEFNGGQPDDPDERDIWNRRAALVDVFVYDA